MKRYLVALIVLTSIVIGALFFNLKKSPSPFHVSKKNNAITKNLLSKYPVTDEKSFVIVIASYNNETMCEKNLFSVFDQTFTNYRVIYIDDCSTDQTYEKVKNFVKERHQEGKVTLIRNEKRRLKLYNLYKAYMSCKDDEIIVCLDGDDWIAHENVLKELNHYYQNPDIWLTYGSAINHPKYVKKDGACLSDKVLTKNTIRDIPFSISMIRTFYAGLFKKIKLKDLLYQGKFLPSADDFAFMIPMIEMAPTHSLYIPEVLYIINDSNPIRESSVIESLQVKLMKYLKAKEKYQPLDVTFNPRDLQILATRTPIDLIVLSYDAPEMLEKSLQSLISNLPSPCNVYIYYRATTVANHKAYQDLITDFSKVNFVLDSELSLNELIKKSSPYIAITTDNFILTEPVNLFDCAKEMELTHSVNFFLKQPTTPSNSLQLKDSIFALSIENALKNPALLTDSFFVLSQKQFLIENFDSENPFHDFIKSLYIKEKNHSETALLQN